MALEAIWPYNRAMEALGRIAAERPEVQVREFLEEMLRTPLPDRPAFAFEWGRQAADFAHFKRRLRRRQRPVTIRGRKRR